MWKLSWKYPWVWNDHDDADDYDDDDDHVHDDDDHYDDDDLNFDLCRSLAARYPWVWEKMQRRNLENLAY